MSLTVESVRKTTESYRKAFAEAASLVKDGILNFDSSGGGQVLFLPQHLSGRGHVRDASRIIVRRDPLWEFVQPRRFKPTHYTWRSDFFRATAIRDIPYELFERSLDRSDGEYLDTHSVKPRPGYNIRLRLAERSWGLKDWHIKADEIKGWANEAPPEARGQYLGQYEAACQQVAEWEEAQRTLTALTIPTDA